jgi:hypothetical protein|tara:strand:+ start:479 stop:1303 length:825 start_codon:yes stop_codon:yes gene_type:complete
VSYEEKYAVSKRRQQIGTFTAKEIIKLLRKREFSTIHKVKVENEEMTVGAFVAAHEAGDLPEQNIDKPKPEETKPKETKQKKAGKVATKPSKTAAPPSKSTTDSSKPPAPPPPPSAPTGKPQQTQGKGANRKPAQSIKAREGSGQRAAKPRRDKRSGAGVGRPESYLQEEEPGNPIRKALWSALVIVLFFIMAYVGSSLLNHYKLEGRIEMVLQQSLRLDADTVEVTGLTLEGYYFFDDPRHATVEVLKDGEPRTYEFKVTGNGITRSVQLELQ